MDGVYAQREWELPSRLGAEKPLMHAVEQFVLQYAPHETRTEDIKTAVAEAFLNAAEHGNQFGPDTVSVSVHISEAGIWVRVCDRGSGFTYVPLQTKIEQKLPEANPRGWGMQFISRLADRLYVEEKPPFFCVVFTFERNGIGGERHV